MFVRILSLNNKRANLINDFNQIIFFFFFLFIDLIFFLSLESKSSCLILVQQHRLIRVSWHNQHQSIKTVLQVDFYSIQQQHSQAHSHQHHSDQQVYSVRRSRSLSMVIGRVHFSGGTTPSTSTLQIPSTGTGTGTIHKFDPAISSDKINKNGIQTQIRTKLFNVCAMPVYEKKSMEVSSMKSHFTKNTLLLCRNFD